MTKRKKVLGIIITFAMFISFIPILEVQAKDNTHANIFPYVMFADKITIDSRSNVINGNVHTLKPVKGLNISGNISKDKNEKQIDKQLSIISDFFINNNYKQTENIYSDNSINISSSFDYSVGSIKNIDICAEVINTNNSVLYSKDGDINFNCKNVNFSGLIYAPQGNVNISADNINIDGIIISKSISIKGLNVNINNNTFFENYLGNSSDSYYEESDIYTYKYDVFGKTKSISIDNQLLVEYVYSNSFNSKLLYEKFGNGTFKNYSNSSDSKSTQLEKYISESLVDRKHNSSENYTELTNTYNNNKSISTYYCDNDLNIIKDTNDQKDRTYVYDEKNQLVRANDQKANKSYTYSYDSRGNIINTTEYDYSLSELLNPIHTTDYKYNNQWLDRLDSYEGNMITYDQIGNPTYYKGWSFSWEKGRQLKSASNGNNSIIYSYDNNGLRTKKQVNDEQIYFTYIEDYLVEQHSNNSNLIFKYDKSKNIIGVNINGEDFYYIKSLQGDVSKIVNSRNEIVVEYNYDPWGKITLISGKLSDSIGLINPIRYRGYYYDNETNLYYLQSRYYDPDTCRFINADDFCFINCDINLFKSCHNNPIKYKDAKGLYPINSYYDYLYYQYKIERDNKVSATKVNINKKNIEQYKKNFVLWIYPMFADYECYAKENSKRYVPPAIATAQWSIESAYGASIPKDKNTNSNSNNYIGLKAYGTDPYVICNTREVINGKNVYVDAKFYKFSDVYQCRDKYTSLLTGNKYYVNSSNNQTWANSLQTNGYATDPSYASTIMSVINYWGLQ